MRGIPDELNLFRMKRLPVLLSAETAECGLVSLAMIARYHGHNIDLNALRQRYSLSMAGATLRNVMELADQLDFTTRAIRCELEGLAHISMPALLHWDLSHFVVLASVGKSSITIHDPSVGRRVLSFDEASKHFTGVGLELAPSQHFKPIHDRSPVRLSTLWSKVSGFGRTIGQVLALSVGLQVAVFAAPFQLQLVVDEAIGRADADLLVVLAIGFGALVCITAAIEALRSYVLQVFGHLLSFQMIGNLVRHLLRLKTDFFEKRHVGDVLSRIQSTVPIQQAVTQGVIAILIDGLMAIVALAILFFYSVKLTLIVLAALMLSLVVTFAFYPMVRRRSEEHISAAAKEQTHLIESVRGATTVKLLGRETERESHWRNLFADTINASFSVGKFQIAKTGLQFLITGLQTVVVIFVASRMILAAEGFSVGMLMAYLSFRQTFSDRVIALINQGFEFRLLGLHLERIGDIVNAEADEPSSSGMRSRSFRGAIALHEVSFQYGSNTPQILNGISLEVDPGDYIAITGASGGGKTTLLKLMLGLYPPTRGSIEIDGMKATPELWRAWRSNLGVVAQDDRLFSGTLADNISFFEPNLDQERVVEAAKAAQIHEDIEAMPMQYMSLVGDMGSTLSGGQKQRVLIARALYRQPQILVLDEGTANLDTDTEALIGDLIEELDVTRIVVAHRPALIARASRVITMTNGQIIEQAEDVYAQTNVAE